MSPSPPHLTQVMAFVCEVRTNWQFLQKSALHQPVPDRREACKVPFNKLPFRRIALGGDIPNTDRSVF